jgi:CTP synthase (UTP-ammonia lyase)
MTRIAILGDRDERHLTHREIDAALALFPADIDAGWVATDSEAPPGLDRVDGVWLVSGGPYGSDAAVLAAIDHCIGSGKPFLGTCSGFQYACLALARRQGIDAVHAELDPEAENPLIGALACTLYGEERLVVPVRGSRLAAICGLDPFPGYHYCGFGLAPEHEPTIERAGVLFRLARMMPAPRQSSS